MNAVVLHDSEYGFLFNDSVIFKVDITVIGDLETSSYPVVSTLHNKENTSLHGCMKMLLESQIHADLVLKSPNNEFNFNVHQCILNARSPVFKSMIAESSKKELVITDIDEEVLKELINFIYTDECSDNLVFDKMAGSILIASNKFSIDGLKRLAEDYLKLHINHENVINILILANSCSTKLKEACLQYIGQNHSGIVHTKEFEMLEGDLLKEILAVLNIAMKRKGCGNHFTDTGEKRFTSFCSIM